MSSCWPGPERDVQPDEAVAVPREPGRGRLLAVVRGRVQGVGYRWFVREEASRLGLAGWVRNRADGAVEVWAEGRSGALDSLLAALQAGPRGAHVTGIEATRGPAEGMDTGFEIRSGAHLGD